MNILIVDDHPLFIDGISYVVKRLAENVEVTTAISIDEATKILTSKNNFDLILLDLDLPGMNGLSLLTRFKAEELCIPVIIVSAEVKIGMIQSTLNWGAMGFIPKSFSADKMLSAITSVIEGEIYIPENIQTQLQRLPASNTSKTLPESLQQSGITQKQFQVLKLLTNGCSNLQIANTLNRTEHTVKSHVTALLQILNAKNRMECVDIARKRGLI